MVAERQASQSAHSRFPHHHHVLQLPTAGSGVALLATIPATGRSGGVSGQLIQGARPSLGLTLALLVAPLSTPPASSPELAGTATLSSVAVLAGTRTCASGKEVVRGCSRRHWSASGVQKRLELHGPRQCCLHIH